MNPYGPAWVDPGSQDGPVLLLGGYLDGTTPPDSYDAVWDAIVEEYTDHGGPGGVNVVLADGTHNSEAWGVDDVTGETLGWEEAQEINFGEYQLVTELWWDFHLNGNERSGRTLKKLLEDDPWEDTQYAFTDNFDL